MKISTSWNTSTNTQTAVSAAYAQLQQDLGGAPDWLAVHASVAHDSATLMATLSQAAPNVGLHGGTSCRGVMTADGFHTADGVGLGLFGLKDPAGRYGIGVEPSSANARAAGATAAQKAMAAAGRAGELPELIWLTGAPGAEEDVVRGIQDVVGAKVPVVGGSAADNTIEGHWRQFANGEVHSDGVVVTAMYPSTRVHTAVRSGYYPTQFSGTVTRASGRTIHTIDGRPAAEVYNEWTNGAIDGFLNGGNVLQPTTLHPLGRVVKQIGELTFHRLSHPAEVVRDGGLALFTNFEVGEEITLMMGTRASLVTRAGVVVQSALQSSSVSPSQIAGGLVIFCAGCMLAVQDAMDDVAANIRGALGGRPFLGTFTFGEQGCFIDGQNHHANLMISAVLFER